MKVNFMFYSADVRLRQLDKQTEAKVHRNGSEVKINRPCNSNFLTVNVPLWWWLGWGADCEIITINNKQFLILLLSESLYLTAHSRSHTLFFLVPILKTSC